jgi:hypothetical protein
MVRSQEPFRGPNLPVRRINRESLYLLRDAAYDTWLLSPGSTRAKETR